MENSTAPGTDLAPLLAAGTEAHGHTHFVFVAPAQETAWGTLFEDHIRYHQQPSDDLLQGHTLAVFRIPRGELTAQAKQADVTIERIDSTP